MSKSIKQAAGLLLSLGLVAGVHSAPITWGSAQNTASASDVATAGSTHEAVNLTSAIGSTTVNGVTFTNSNLLLDNTTAADFLPGAATSGDASYDALLEGLDFGNGFTEDLTLGGGSLTVGTTYLLQLWFTDLRSCCSGRDMIYGDGEGNTVTLGATGSGLGQYAIGYFTADAAGQTLSLSTNQAFANVHLTAYQLRAIPEPGTLALLALALPLAASLRLRRG